MKITVWKTIVAFGWVAAIAACGGGEGDAPAANEAAPVLVLSAKPFFPAEMTGLDTAMVSVSAQLLVDDGAAAGKSGLRAVTSPVQSVSAGDRWQWVLGEVPDGAYVTQLTYVVGSIPIATAEIAALLEEGGGELEIRDSDFVEVGGGDLDKDGLTNLAELLKKTDPAKPDSDDDGLLDGGEKLTDPLKADTDGDAVGDKQDAFPLDPKEGKDSDGDGKGDASDNCLLVKNTDQADVDKDGKGDPCDAINDDTYDGDGDGVIDKKDAFPLDPKEWADSDADIVGNNSDNCPDKANTDQTNTDQALAKAGAVVVADGKGDACDDDPDGDGRNVVYVDGKNGKDASTGYYQAPVQTISQGMLFANQRNNADIWVAAGDYEVSKVVWLKGAQLFGGYTASFDPAARDFVVDDGSHTTWLTAPGKTAVLFLQNLSTDTRFDGFHVTADAVSAASSAAIAIDNSVVTLANCTVTGNSASSDDAAVRVQNTGFATLSGDTLNAKGSAQGVDSTGLWVSGSTLTAVQLKVNAGDAPHATGIRLISTTATIIDSTISVVTSVKTQQRSTGIWLAETTPKLLKNDITATGVQAEGIYFEKDPALPAGTVIQDNTVYTGGPPNPLLRDWYGVSYTEVEGGDFKATFADGVTTQLFVERVGAANTGGNTEGE